MGLAGVGGDQLTAVGPDLFGAAAFIIAGPPRSGRTTALVTMARSSSPGAQLVLVTPRANRRCDSLAEPGVVASFESAAIS